MIDKSCLACRFYRVVQCLPLVRHVVTVTFMSFYECFYRFCFRRLLSCFTLSVKLRLSSFQPKPPPVKKAEPPKKVEPVKKPGTREESGASEEAREEGRGTGTQEARASACHRADTLTDYVVQPDAQA